MTPLTCSTQSVEEACKMAAWEGKAVLLSEPVPHTGEVFCDEALRWAARASVCRQFAWFWSSPHDACWAGIGTAARIIGDREVCVTDAAGIPVPVGTESAGGKGKGRFAWGDEALADLFSRVVGHGTPVCVGTFAFGEGGAMGEEWQGLPRTFLTVPEFVIRDGSPTSNGTDTAATHPEVIWNALVLPGDGPEVVRARQATAFVRLGELRDAPPVHEDWAETLVRSYPKPDAYMSAVCSVVDLIKAGEAEKVVLARSVRLQGEGTFDLERMLRALLPANPSCIVFACAAPFAEGAPVFFGATPELLLRSDGMQIESLCLAGTIGRTGTVQEDEISAQALLSDPKNRMEHALLADEVEQVFRLVCEDVQRDVVPRKLFLGNLTHLATRVSGRVQEGRRFLEILGDLHPTPAVGAVPREIIGAIPAIEGIERGWYAGPVGWTDGVGGEFALALRCGLTRGHQATLYAGAGIVAESDPRAELQETRLKFRSMLDVLLRV